MNTPDYWYNQTHRLKFTIDNTNYDTWTNWHLIPTNKPVPPVPEFQTESFITVSYADGSKKILSVKSSYNQNNKYDYGEGSAEFIITSDNPDPIYHAVVAAIHGKKGSVQFLDDEHTYYGTFTVDKYSPEDRYSTITIGYKVKQTDDSGDIVDKNNITEALAHGVTFTIGSTSKKTWTDWGMISEEPILVEPPSVKTNYVTVPAANGQIDLSEAVAGHVLYDNSSGSISFTVTDDAPLTVYYNVMQFLHGMRGTMTPADGGGTFTGRFSVDGYSVSDGQFKITIGYNVLPYINRGN